MTVEAQGRRPRLSIVLAVYNGERYLREAVDSLLTQTFRDFELIVVNDGSTDRSRDIVLANSDPRVRLLENARNLGLTPSLNRGIEAARGEFVARLDADDIARPDRLARQVAFLDQHPDIALVGSWYRTIDEHGRRRERGQFPLEHSELRWSLMFYCPFTHSAVTWRRQLVTDTVGAYDETFAYAMDWEFWSRVASRLRVANIGRVLTYYRVSPQSMSSSHPRVRVEIAAAREASMRAIFGADAGPWVAEGSRLFSLIDGWPANASRSDLLESVDAAARLHEAFANQLAIAGPALDEQRRWFRAWTARRLFTAGRKAHRAGHHALGGLLFSEARQIYTPALLTINCGRYFVARMLSALSPAKNGPESRKSNT